MPAGQSRRISEGFIMKYLITLLLLLCGLETLDGVLTQGAVTNGLVQEANPLMAHIVHEGNFLLLKIAGALLCAMILWNLYQRFPKLALSATSGIVVFYGMVMVWNFYVLCVV